MRFLASAPPGGHRALGGAGKIDAEHDVGHRFALRARLDEGLEESGLAPLASILDHDLDGPQIGDRTSLAIVGEDRDPGPDGL